MAAAGLDPDRTISDGRDGVLLAEDDDYGAAAYVDNYAAAGLDAGRVDELCDRVSEALRGQGLV
eukprot:9307200-Lingulodinium_polyedra.AAC.1